MNAIGVRLDNLSKRFAHRVKGEVYAARDVTLDVAPGEFVTLLGPSGCGKTTTLRMIAGFEHPDTGRIAFDTEDVTRLPANQRGIGFVFQNYALFPHLPVFENVAYGLRVRGVSSEAIAHDVREVLALVGLAGYEQQFPAQLSGGEQQRVALARAIVIKPRVLLFDEPLSNLDAKLRVQMRSDIRALQQRLAITTIYVTHDQEEAMAVSDRIAVMHQGTIVQLGSAQALYQRPESLFVAQFIGRVNSLAAKVQAIASGHAIVRALGVDFEVRDFAGTLVKDAPAWLLVRPEGISIGRVDDATPALTASIVSRTFLGEKVEYVLRCQDEMLQAVRGGSDFGFAAGAVVKLHIDTTALAVLPREHV
jgi:ABC-type Fe3+/spermidine/putrescine transport system ATPase subunit